MATKSFANQAYQMFKQLDPDAKWTIDAKNKKATVKEMIGDMGLILTITDKQVIVTIGKGKELAGGWRVQFNTSSLDLVRKLVEMASLFRDQEKREAVLALLTMNNAMNTTIPVDTNEMTGEERTTLLEDILMKSKKINKDSAGNLN